MFDAYARLVLGAPGLEGRRRWPNCTPTIDARLALRPDPLAYAAAANSPDRARRPGSIGPRPWPLAGLDAGERFITENEPSYKLGGKVQASRDRNRAQFTDLVGWAAFLQGDLATAAQKLDEAARFVERQRLPEPVPPRPAGAGTTGDAETARERYYDALSLESAAAAGADARRRAGRAGGDLRRRRHVAGRGATANIARELDRRRDERRRALLSIGGGQGAAGAADHRPGRHAGQSLADAPGNVTLLNFFAAW